MAVLASDAVACAQQLYSRAATVALPCTAADQYSHRVSASSGAEYRSCDRRTAESSGAMCVL